VPDSDPETERVRRIYDRRARLTAPPRNDVGCRWLCSQASGDVLEIGIGRGRTLPYYPPGTKLTAIELSGVSAGVAMSRARELGMHAAIRQGDATALPFPDAHFDTIVFCHALCTIPDDRKAMAEAVRVLRPGGRILALEHVRSPNVVVRALEHVFEPLERWRMGDHLLREPVDLALAQGLEIETLERRFLGLIERLAARKPDLEQLELAG
jgi:ubiquinone/menaquinone biosynthesis C-methylase UbiE